jgi:hypothetical protein
MYTVLPKSKLPWRWGEGWEELEEAYQAYEDEDQSLEPGPNSNEYGEFRRDKYMDLRLLGADNEEVLPIRVDHYDFMFDTHENGDPPCKQDREFILIACNFHFDMIHMLNTLWYEICLADENNRKPEFTDIEEARILDLFERLNAAHNPEARSVPLISE